MHKMIRFYGVLMIGLLMFLVAACEQDEQDDPTPEPDSLPVHSQHIKRVVDIGLLTGEDSLNQTKSLWDVGGTDLGIPIYDPDQEVMYIAFGDTFSNQNQTGNFRSNILAVTTDLDPSDNIEIDYFINNNRPIAREIIPSRKVNQLEITTIPTGGIVIEGDLYLFYMSVREWLTPGEWDINYNGVVKSSDGGETWEAIEDLRWAESTSQPVQTVTGLSREELLDRLAPNFLQVYPVLAEDGFIYIYGIRGGRSGGAKLGRVAVESFEDFSAYEYFTGFDDQQEPIFIQGSEGLAAIRDSEASFVIPPMVAEISVIFNPYLDKWLTVYQIGSNLIYRTADHPWGPWSRPEIIVTYAEFDILYCGFMNARYTEQDGKIVYLIMSQWAPIYNSRVLKVEFK